MWVEERGEQMPDGSIRELLVASARRRFLNGERIDIASLGAEHGLSRATAYRRLGNYEALVGEVLGTLVTDTFRTCEAEARVRGAGRVVDVVGRFLRYLAGCEPYRAFLERDPQQALRIVTTSATGVQRRVVGLVQDLLETEAARSDLVLPLDAHVLAYSIVRIMESFLYADIIAGEKPDIDRAVDLVTLILRAPEQAKAETPSTRKHS
jgi:hypothetical protein